MFKIVSNHLHIKFLGIRIKLKINFIKNFQNKIYEIDNNGKLRRKFFLPKGIRVVFLGENSIVKFAKSKKYKNIVIRMSHNSSVEIEKPNNFAINNLYVEMGRNCNLSIAKDFSCVSGDLIITGDNTGVKIGEGCMFSRNFRITTDDSHVILDKYTMNPINEPKSIVIRDRVWVGLDVKILKGVTIENDSIIATGAIVSKSPLESNVIIAGVPAKIVKKGICWNRKGYNDYLNEVVNG